MIAPNRRCLLATLTAAILAPQTVAAQDRRAVRIPIRINDGRVLVQTMLDGQGPFDFVIDTGAEVSGLSTAAVARLRLRPSRSMRVAGRAADMFVVGEVTLGGAVSQSDVIFFGIEGRSLGGDGLLAAGAITGFDSDLLLQEGSWVIYPHGRLDGSDGFSPIPSRLVASDVQGLSSRIAAASRVNGHPFETVVDTGSPWPVALDWGTAEAIGLLAPEVAFAPTLYTAVGRRFPTPGRLVRLNSLSMGHVDFAQLLALIRPEGAPAIGPVVGLPVIRTLDLAFDRAAERLSVRRSGARVDDPPYRGSGLWLGERRGAVVIGAVGVGSPAARAGVQVGDVVLGHVSLQEALSAIHRAPGEEISLSIDRRGRRHDYRMTVAAYLKDANELQ